MHFLSRRHFCYVMTGISLYLSFNFLTCGHWINNKENLVQWRFKDIYYCSNKRNHKKLGCSRREDKKPREWACHQLALSWIFKSFFCFSSIADKFMEWSTINFLQRNLHIWCWYSTVRVWNFKQVVGGSNIWKFS